LYRNTAGLASSYILLENGHAHSKVSHATTKRKMTKSPTIATFMEDASSSTFQLKSKPQSSLYHLHTLLHSSGLRSKVRLTGSMDAEARNLIPLILSAARLLFANLRRSNIARPFANISSYRACVLHCVLWRIARYATSGRS
jgi:hypothetical protein